MEIASGPSALTAEQATGVVRRYRSGATVVDLAHLSDGIANTSYRLRLSNDELLVLRLYRRDPSACLKELAIHEIIGGRVPVPEILHAEPNGVDGVGPFALLRFVQGITLQELKRTGDASAVAQAARSAGETLAELGEFEFDRAGWLQIGQQGLEVGGGLIEGEQTDQLPRFVDQCLTSTHARDRLGLEGADRVRKYVWSWAPRLSALPEERRLVHCDYGNRNIVVREGPAGWHVAAVLDWEFAVAATPLIDIGHFLRYDRPGRPRVEPHFSRGYTEAGGTLPDGWRSLARVIDLSALVELLSRERLLHALVPELVELVMAAVEERGL